MWGSGGLIDLGKQVRCPQQGSVFSETKSATCYWGHWFAEQYPFAESPPNCLENACRSLYSTINSTHEFIFCMTLLNSMVLWSERLSLCRCGTPLDLWSESRIICEVMIDQIFYWLSESEVGRWASTELWDCPFSLLAPACLPLPLPLLHPLIHHPLIQLCWPYGYT